MEWKNRNDSPPILEVSRGSSMLTLLLSSRFKIVFESFVENSYLRNWAAIKRLFN